MFWRRILTSRKCFYKSHLVTQNLGYNYLNFRIYSGISANIITYCTNNYKWQKGFPQFLTDSKYLRLQKIWYTPGLLDGDASTFLQKDEQELQKITELFPQPRVTLNEVSAKTPDKIFEIHYKQNMTSPKLARKKQKPQANGWTCTYALVWPEKIKFESTSLSKRQAAEKAATQVLHYLYSNKRIDSKGNPIYDREQIEELRSGIQETIQISISEKSMERIEKIWNEYESGIKDIYETTFKTAALKIKAPPPVLTKDSTIDDDDDFIETEASDVEAGNILDTNPHIHPVFGRTVLPPTESFLRKRDRILAQKFERYDEELTPLPIDQYAEQIMQAVGQCRVAVVAGAAGCGKSTRVPAAALRGGARAAVLVAEPRRVAAVSLAHRVAAELAEQVGESVGYQVRLQARPPRPPAGGLLYCTSGILLKRLQANPGLQGCTHVFVDEAHERDVNTDITLLLLKRALHVNPELKVIVMSATLDIDVLTRYFDGCPVIEVPGRTFPVTVSYLEHIQEQFNLRLPSTLDNCQRKDGKPQINCQEIVEVIKAVDRSGAEGAILVFLPGWAEIRQTKQLLDNICPESTHMVLPVHSRLSTTDQSKMFAKPLPGVRKIVLATNIAETSITIPDVVHVIDSGAHKENRLKEGTGKIVLATNIAETSITIPDVVHVIDSGAHKENRLKEGTGKIVLATNIAETSITIPDVVHVIDSGAHKENRLKEGTGKIVLATNIAETSITIPDVVHVIDSGAHKENRLKEGTGKIVLATNIAETSITIPDVVHVIDSGAHKENRLKEGTGKIVLATNIAETSITIPDVVHVIDSGAHKENRLKEGTGKIVVATNIAETSITISDVVHVIDSGAHKENRLKEGTGKIVLATNIAETSITIPDVVHVIDSGAHKENRLKEGTGKIVLATNIAETSITIPDVVHVIDSGAHKENRLKEGTGKIVLATNIAETSITIPDVVHVIDSGAHKENRLKEGTGKIVLATNIAETSITIPDVVHVIDSGAHKENRLKEGTGKIVLATNIAETSITIPDVVHVIDSGAHKENRLKEGTGHCYKMYTKEKESEFSPHTTPEILRMPLEQTVLDCKAYAPDDKVENFLSQLPQPPTQKAIQFAVNDLIELGALTADEQLTGLGRVLARLALPPRAGAALLRAATGGGALATARALLAPTTTPFHHAPDRRTEIREFKRKYSETSDHAALHWIQDDFEQHVEQLGWRGVDDWCDKYGLSKERLRYIQSLTDLHLEQLLQSGAIDPTIDAQELNRFSSIDELTAAFLLSGADSLIRTQRYVRTSGKLRAVTGLFTARGERAHVGSDSVNHGRRAPAILVYSGGLHCPERRALVVHNTSLVPPHTALLFTMGRVTKDPTPSSNGGTVVLSLPKHRLQVHMPSSQAEHMLQAREMLWNTFKYYIERDLKTLDYDENTRISRFKVRLVKALGRILVEGHRECVIGKKTNDAIVEVQR